MTDEDLQEQQLMELVQQYQDASSYADKKKYLAAIANMAQLGYVGACYVFGASLLGEGPCGGLAEPNSESNRENARKFLQQAHELGDPLAQTLIENHNLN